MSSKNSNKNDIERQFLSNYEPQVNINYWSIVNGIEKLIDGTIKTVQFSIQDIPKERYDEVISHMEKYFVVDEATCKSLKLADDKDAISDFRILWNYILKQGISIGAYKMNSNNTLCKLVAVNLLFLITDEQENDLENIQKNFKSKKGKKLFQVFNQISNVVNIFNIYKVNTYITAFGLSVERAFRGQKLGFYLLQARNLIGQKYGITITSTIFSALPSQIQAERAGFKTIFRQEYSEILDEDGKPLFPNIETKELKVMIKQLK